MAANGIFVISLDFELFWGVRDKRTVDSYGASLEKVHEIVPKTLALFEEYGIRATFATVGFMFAKEKSELFEFSPKLKPNYLDKNLSPYLDNFELVNNNFQSDLYHNGFELIKQIKKSPGQELASHTFSHFYCQEQGQTITHFEEDIKSAVFIAKSKGVKISSLVFPRNQCAKEYLNVCQKYGIKTYRGNEDVWFHLPESEEKTTFMKKVFRTADCYFNLSGSHTYSLDDIAHNLPYNLPSSRFLRPFRKSIGEILEKLKLSRIKKSMSKAAKNNKIYHLWWHPHNFGANTDENFKTLIEILEHFRQLEQETGFTSHNMEEIGSILDNKNEIRSEDV